jgi:hypothetical protein
VGRGLIAAKSGDRSAKIMNGLMFEASARST